MTKISDILNKESRGPAISFELSPPKSEKAAENLQTTIDELNAFNPDFFSVTFGAGGSTREGSHALVENLKKTRGHEVVAYVAPYGMAPGDVEQVLDGYRDLEITNILAIRGDEPRDLEGFTPHQESFKFASDLIAFINEKYDFHVGGAGYPEGHAEAESIEKDIEVLKTKQDNGAQFIICQYFYDNEYFFEFQKRASEAGITVPLIPGIMPIYSEKMMRILAGVCGATITEEIEAALKELPEGDKESFQAWGVDFGYKQCRGLIEHGVPGLHFYTLNKRTTSMKILAKLKEDGLL